MCEDGGWWVKFEVINVVVAKLTDSEGGYIWSLLQHITNMELAILIWNGENKEIQLDQWQLLDKAKRKWLSEFKHHMPKMRCYHEGVVRGPIVKISWFQQRKVYCDLWRCDHIRDSNTINPESMAFHLVQWGMRIWSAASTRSWLSISATILMDRGHWVERDNQAQAQSDLWMMFTCCSHWNDMNNHNAPVDSTVERQWRQTCDGYRIWFLSVILSIITVFQRHK